MLLFTLDCLPSTSKYTAECRGAVPELMTNICLETVNNAHAQLSGNSEKDAAKMEKDEACDLVA